jgi:uncharacterized protein
MIFVDTNVFMYAVGRAHPLREPARRFFEQALDHAGRQRLCTSAEVLQELMHAYLPVGRVETLDAALTLARGVTQEIWPIEPADVEVARALMDTHAELGARDLLHLACCRRRDITAVQTYDRALAAAFRSSAT